MKWSTCNEILCEDAGQQYLYHFTELHSLENIIKTGVIASTLWDDVAHRCKVDPSRGISLTRNKHLNFCNYPIRLCIDYNKLKQNYKLTQYQDHSMKVKPNQSRRTEAEERTYKPVPISYIIGIDMKPRERQQTEAEIKRFEQERDEKVDRIQDLMHTPNYDEKQLKMLKLSLTNTNSYIAIYNQILNKVTGEF